MASSSSIIPSSFFFPSSSYRSRRNYGVFLSFRGPDTRQTIVKMIKSCPNSNPISACSHRMPSSNISSSSSSSSSYSSASSSSSSYSSASSSSSSSMSRRNYGVFLSFRGLDTRSTIVSHLYNALTLKGVYVFKDNLELEAGQSRSELFDAIEGTRVAVVVFSKNFASSKWCLDELQKIMECKDRGYLTVIPLFYQVTPREVRLHPKDNAKKGCYQMAIEEMEKTYGKDSEMVKSWRKALWRGGDMIGFSFDHGKDEGIVVQDVVDRVLGILNRLFPEVARYPVGIDHRLEEIRPLLHLDPHVDDVCMIGIHGQGGVGKTTLAKAICNEIADKFDSWCFLPKVRETTLTDGLAKLQESLLRDLSSNKGLTVSSEDVGKSLIKDRLCKKRVLVILDDVDEPNQLEALAGDLKWFGKGSRIILTTRNKHVLTSHGAKVYKLNFLNKEEADRLFRLYAFGETQEKIDIDGDLINHFVEYAGGLPLAIQVLGAILRGRVESDWKGKLKELTLRPERGINKVLKLSFDVLEERHREMFLDVACFYDGWHIDRVEHILDSCWNSSLFGISELINRCLITIVDKHVQMHDLIEEMGRSIVAEGKPKNRIWSYEDFVDIMSKDKVKEKKAVTGIVLNYSREHKEKRIIKSSSLKDFEMLRVLVVRETTTFHLEERTLRLPIELRWFEWHQCHASTIEFDPYCKLVGLVLVGGAVQQIKTTEGFEELRVVDFLYCVSLETLPDLSRSRKLEVLCLEFCSRLTKLDEAIGSLENLVHLNIISCNGILTVPSSLRSKHLKTLNFHCCSKLKKMPDIMNEQKFIEVLNLSGTAIKELPDSIKNLVALKGLGSRDCKELTVIPSSIYRMQALEWIDFLGCRKLSMFPRNDHAGGAIDALGFPCLVTLNLGNCVLKDLEFLNDLTCFDTLIELKLGGNEFTRVPASISKFKNLNVLWLDCCKQLVEVMELPNVSNLHVCKCPQLKVFPSLHTFISRSPALFYLDLSGCHRLDRGYIERTLSLEHVRGFVALVNVVYPGEEFPKWVNFQETVMSFMGGYSMSLRPNMSTGDLFGLAIFASFKFKQAFSHRLNVWVNNVPFYGFETKSDAGVVHSFFFYFPGKSIVLRDRDIHVKFGGHELYFALKVKDVELRRFGMRLLCKREEDDNLINIRKDGDDEGDFS